jgi:transcriptional regulator with XRE-family HTH domain
MARPLLRGDRLQAAREAAGLTRDELTAPGLSVMTYVRLEDGRPGVDHSAKVIAAVAEALGVDVARVEAAVRRSRSDHAAMASFGS